MDSFKVPITSGFQSDFIAELAYILEHVDDTFVAAQRFVNRIEKRLLIIKDMNETKHGLNDVEKKLERNWMSQNLPSILQVFVNRYDAMDFIKHVFDSQKVVIGIGSTNLKVDLVSLMSCHTKINQVVA